MQNKNNRKALRSAKESVPGTTTGKLSSIISDFVESLPSRQQQVDILNKAFKRTVEFLREKKENSSY